jgi:xanthine/uracil permease
LFPEIGLLESWQFISFIGLLLILIELGLFIGGLIQGTIVTETIPPLVVGLVILIIGVSLIRYNIQKGAF